MFYRENRFSVYAIKTDLLISKKKNQKTKEQKMKSKASIFFSTLCVIHSTQGAITVTNGNMENNSLLNSGDFTGGVVPVGWASLGNASTIGEDRFDVNEDTDGVAWLQLQNSGQSATGGTSAGISIGDIASNLGVTITATYTLTRRLNQGNAVDHTLSFYAGTATTWVGGEVLAAGAIDADLLNTTRSDSGSFYLGNQDLTLPSSYAGTNTNLWVVITNDLPTDSGSRQLHLDDVNLSVVPEPATGGLLAFLSLSLLLRRERNQ